MKKRNKSWRWSQALALFVLTGAVLIMSAPFRGGSAGMTRMQSASVVPLLTATSLAHGASFQARSLADRVACSGVSVFRSAPVVKLVQRREIVVRKRVSPMPVDFQAPRTGWAHLSREGREQLDRLANNAEMRGVEIRSTGTERGNLADLERRAQVLGGAGGARGLGRAVVIGGGVGAGDGVVEVASDDEAEVRPLAIYLVGDFNRSGVTRAQWEALDEVLDYLAMKWGRVGVSVRPVFGESGGRAGLGPMFPTEAFLRALSPAAGGGGG